MMEIDHEEPEVIEDVDVDEDEYEVFDVQVWAEAYLADVEAQAEHARFPGVPFH